MTAAPHAAYLAALDRAAGRSAALLVDSGVASAGLPRLRELLAERYTRAGLATRPEQILVTSGAQSALTLLTDQLHTDRGAPVLIESPTYPGALSVLRHRRARLLPVQILWSGLRVGWIRATAEVVRALRRNPLQAQLSPLPLEQLIAAELLGEGLDEILVDRRTRLRAQRDHLASLLADTGWTYTVPEGGLSLWIRLDDRTTAAELERRAVAQGLAVTPGPLFASDRTTLSRHLRLPFTATQETLTRAVDILRRLEPR